MFLRVPLAIGGNLNSVMRYYPCAFLRKTGFRPCANNPSRFYKPWRACGLHALESTYRLL